MSRNIALLFAIFINLTVFSHCAVDPKEVKLIAASVVSNIY